MGWKVHVYKVNVHMALGPVGHLFEVLFSPVRFFSPDTTVNKLLFSEKKQVITQDGLSAPGELWDGRLLTSYPTVITRPGICRNTAKKEKHKGHD